MSDAIQSTYGRAVLRAYESLGAGERLQLLRRLGLSTKRVTPLVPHEQLKEATRLIVAGVEPGDFRRVFAAMTGREFTAPLPEIVEHAPTPGGGGVNLVKVGIDYCVTHRQIPTARRLKDGEVESYCDIMAHPPDTDWLADCVLRPLVYSEQLVNDFTATIIDEIAPPPDERHFLQSIGSTLRCRCGREFHATEALNAHLEGNR